MNPSSWFRTPFLVLTLMTGCPEKIDDIDSSTSCSDYCTKAANCRDATPTDEETASCEAACRDDIEDHCGNDLQSQANEVIDTCVDLACDDFWPCLVLDDAPQCFDFVDDDRP